MQILAEECSEILPPDGKHSAWCTNDVVSLLNKPHGVVTSAGNTNFRSKLLKAAWKGPPASSGPSERPSKKGGSCILSAPLACMFDDSHERVFTDSLPSLSLSRGEAKAYQRNQEEAQRSSPA